MAGAYAGACMLCGRTVGYAVEGRFYTRPGGRRPQPQGRHLRCSDCGGDLLFELDVMPAWLAEMREGKVSSLRGARAVRRRAG
jgi:hypothetical protein